jgi:hypothetical protein
VRLILSVVVREHESRAATACCTTAYAAVCVGVRSLAFGVIHVRWHAVLASCR